MSTIEWIAFAGHNRIAAGNPTEVAVAVKQHVDREGPAQVLVFDGLTSQPVELDLRGTEAHVIERLIIPEAPRGRGRPKLGVVSKEVTLLPRHWEWLQAQPGGASVTLRKLVEVARKATEGQNPQLQLESAYRFMSAVAGNLPGYEEAIRALFAKDQELFRKHTKKWPKDVKKHARGLAFGLYARS